MKFWIWVGCLSVAAILMVTIEQIGGIKLGPLIKTLIAAPAAGVATYLCKRHTTKK